MSTYRTLLSTRRFLITSVCAAIVLAMGVRWGWSFRHQWPDAGLGLLFAGISCGVVLLGMLFVRSTFEASAARLLYDVLALLIWLFIVVANLDVVIHGSATVTGEGREGMMLTPLVTFVLTLGAGVAVWGAGAALGWRRIGADERTGRHPSPGQVACAHCGQVFPSQYYLETVEGRPGYFCSACR